MFKALTALIFAAAIMMVVEAKWYLVETEDGCQWEDNVDYHGNDITYPISGISDADACNMLCVANDACSHWTLDTDKNYCWLKDSDAGREVESNKISGPKCNQGTTTTAPPATTPCPHEDTNAEVCAIVTITPSLCKNDAVSTMCGKTCKCERSAYDENEDHIEGESA